MTEYDKAKMIAETVAEVYGMTLQELRLKSRQRHYCEPRQVAMYMIRKNCGITLSQCGLIFHKDHATVIHAEKAVNNMIDTRYNGIPTLIKKLELAIRMRMADDITCPESWVLSMGSF